MSLASVCYRGGTNRINKWTTLTTLTTLAKNMKSDFISILNSMKFLGNYVLLIRVVFIRNCTKNESPIS